MTTAYKNLIIRADADTRMGTGHIMRCIALAQAWQDQAGRVTFLSHCESESLQERIINEGFEFIPIERSHPDPIDLKKTLSIVSNLTSQSNHSNRTNSTNTPWLVLDGYHFTSDYHKTIRENSCRLLVIDDMAHLDHYYADILLNQNINASNLNYSCDKDTVKLLGCEYILLRREFLKYKKFKRNIPNKAKKILVTMGGADLDNTTVKIIRALNSLNDREIEVKIVAGPTNPNIKSLESELSRTPFTSCLLHSTNDMPELMTWSDIAISAGGSTCWELFFMGLPTISIITAENQRLNTEKLEKLGCLLSIFNNNQFCENDFAKKIEACFSDKEWRQEVSNKAINLVNGYGSRRVINSINEIGDFHDKASRN